MRRHGGVRLINSVSLSDFPQLHLLTLIYLSVSMINADAAITEEYDSDAATFETKTFVSQVGAKSGEFSSPNFPNAYPENARTRFQFRAAAEEVVWITWGTFVLEEPFSSNGLCMRDYVEVIVIDYHNVQHVSGRYCGTNRPPDFKTMQQSVDIIFQSSYTKHYQGFNGTYTFIHEKQLPPPDSRYAGKSDAQAHGCGGLAKGVYGGVIQSPGYPQTYPENIECNWVIRVETGKQVYVRILELQLTASKMDCAEAQLSVIDGYAHYIYENNTTPHEKHMVRFCGEDKYYKEEGARSYMSTRNRMVVRFNTTKPPPKQMRDRREEYGSPIGFYLVWTEVLPIDDKGDKNKQCDKFLCRGGDYCLDETQTVCAERRRYCIDKSLLCDGVPNCAELDESDEENCYSKEIVAAGASLFLLLVLIIVAVICCQRRRGQKQLDHIRRTTNQASRSFSAIGATAVNASNSANAFSSEDTQLLNSTSSKLDAEFSDQRRTDITAFPQNYHPARPSGTSLIQELASSKQPYLSIPNHASTHSAAPVIAKKPVPSAGYREKAGTLSDEDSDEKPALESGSVLRRRQGGNTSSIPASARLPLIKVLSAPEGGEVWEEQEEVGSGELCNAALDRQPKKPVVDTSGIPWSYEQPPIPYSLTRTRLRQRDVDTSGGTVSTSVAGAAGIEMVTFNAAPRSSQTAALRTPVKPQGILKFSSSLPSSSGESREMRSASCVVVPDSVGKRTSVPAPLPQVPVATPTPKPPPPSYSQALARLGRQKAVEFVDELPKRHEVAQQQPPSLPPLTLGPPSGSAVGDATVGSAAGGDRSPSPWHRLKPSMV